MAEEDITLTGSVLGKTSAGRPIIVNNRGGLSTEISTTVKDPRDPSKWINIPTIFGGKIRSVPEALEIIKVNNFKDPETGRGINAFDSISEAERAARERSDSMRKDPAIEEAFRRLEKARGRRK